MPVETLKFVTTCPNVIPFIALGLLLVAGAAYIRIGLALRSGLWVDEITSLAMATGHSLEHTPAVANPALGDYIETPMPQLPSAWRRYAEHAPLVTKLRRVIRAVRFSDVSPPLYYILLNGWTRCWGTSDAALRLFSVFWALICFPLLWILASRLDGRQTAWIALALFAASPAAIYYAAEGRMYSMTLFVGLALAWLTLRLHDEGDWPGLLLLWVLAASAGMLTHYFFAFVGAACGLWLLLYPGQCHRSFLLAAAAAVGLLVLPWYRQIPDPDSPSAWPITSGWLDEPLGLVEVFGCPLRRAANIISGYSGTSAQPGPAGVFAFLSGIFALLLCGATVGWLLWHQDQSPFGPRVQLLWGWAAASVLGVLILDLVLGTGAIRVFRYMLPGLPAALLLLAVFIARLPLLPRWGVVALLVLAWSPAVRAMYLGPSRPSNSFPEIAATIEQAPVKPDLIIIDSIPSGVIGVSRYLHLEIPIASWVVPLGQRQMPTAMTDLVAKRCRVTLVKVHWLIMPGDARDSPPEIWLRANTTLESQMRVPWYSNTEILNFRLKGVAGSSCPEHS
jgi:Dolichyl-phosphate-mannose-protein mannosyltransferase